MSGLGDATFTIDLDTTQLVQGSQKAKQIFREMSDAGLQSMKTVQIESDNTSNSVDKIGDSAQKSAEKVKSSFSSAIGPLTGLSSSSASLYFSFNNLENASIRVEQANLRVQRAQSLVNKLISDGKQGTDQYNQAVQNLQIQQEKYDNVQQNISQNLVYMGLSFTTLATSTIPSAIRAVQALKITQEGFAVALEATMPWLLAITAAILAWEDVIAPLIKQHYNLDLGIQSNIQKLISQHSQVATNTASFNDFSGTMESVDGSLIDTSSSFDTLGRNIGSVTGKLTELDQAFLDFKQTGSFSTQGVSLLDKNDIFTQTMTQIDQIHSIESDIQKLMDNHIDKQTAINMVMEHYMTLLQEEAFQQGESNSQLEKKIQLLQQATQEASKLVDLQKKADVTTNIFGIPDTTFNSIAVDLAKRLGLTVDQVKESFKQNVGAGYNSTLNDMYNLGIRNFGSAWETANQGVSRGLPFYESVGNSIFDTGGINTSTSGLLHNDDVHNMLVQLVASAHMFGSMNNWGNTKDYLRQAVDNGDALQQSQFEQHDSRWQMYYALRNAGLFTGDPNLSLEANLDNAVKAYDSIFTGLRPDVASALEAAHVQMTQTRLYADARSPGLLVTNYVYTTPTADELAYARADSVFATEQEFQRTLNTSKSVLGLTQKQIIDSLSNPLTVNDIQAELEFQSRKAAMSSGTV